MFALCNTKPFLRMIEIQVTLEVAASIAEISKNTDLTDDEVANIAATMGLCLLHRETLRSSGGDGASQPANTVAKSQLMMSPEVRQV